MPYLPLLDSVRNVGCSAIPTNARMLLALCVFFSTGFYSKPACSEPAGSSDAAAPANAEETVDFSRAIRPILSDNCFSCHGPDEDHREADFRLDVEASAKEHVIVPGDINQSLFITRILSDDPDEQMPPPSSGKSLTAEQINLLKRWITQGAHWAGHWSFQPIVKPPLPEPGPANDAISRGWDKNPIDTFVLHRMQQHGLRPSEPADPRTLIRRVTLDLTGLPPDPDDVSAFVKDPSRRAYEELVDRLLASDAYAERMTLAWMDAARYGDTSVMHADGPRDMWPWRDWVIDAYRNNKPFDAFLMEQLAGDLLPDATIEQQLATGFLRNNASSDEGGAFPEELRVEYAVDRVKTTFNVFQGLSAECAQCHTHKYDPISHEEYYQLFAFFNNAADPGMQTRNGNQPPIVRLHTPETLEYLQQVDEEIAAEESIIPSLQPDAQHVATWVDAHTDKAPATHTITWYELSSPFKTTDLPTQFKNTPIVSNGPIDPENPITVGKQPRTWIARKEWNDQKRVKVQSAKDAVHYLIAEFDATGMMAGKIRLDKAHGYAFWQDGNLLYEAPLRSDNKTAAVEFRFTLQPGKNRLLIKLGLRHNRPFDMDWSFQPIPEPPEVLKMAAQLATYHRSKRKAAPSQTRTAEPSPAENAAEPASDQDAAGAPDHGLTEQQAAAFQKKLTEHFRAHLWDELEQHRRTLARLRSQRKQREAASVSCMVMADLPNIRPTYILDRGQYDAPRKDRVILADTPAALGQLGEELPRNRLGLAQWMIRDSNPLTARVAVNRYWYLMFGRGIVETVMDFGAQGAPPTHPDLLDWMAADFRENGWDVKRMLKQIVLSKTYCQSSRMTDTLKQSDPENRWLARASRIRLQGDFIRDQALFISGLLVDRVGGPGTRPYQPDGLWNEVSLNKGLRFRQDHGESLYRRSMYIYWKRSAPHPAMQIFDAPTREKCSVGRPRTNTPLQALVTLNDVQFVEASRKFAERIMVEGGDDFTARLEHAFQICVARAPRQREIQICENVYKAQLASFWDDSERARQYLDHGESRRNEALSLEEHAAWTVLANMLLNLDEVLMRN